MVAHASGGAKRTRAKHTMYNAAKSDDRRKLLEATRNLIATRLDEGVPARDLASLTKRLMEVTKELEAAVAADSVTDPVAVALNEDVEVIEDDED